MALALIAFDFDPLLRVGDLVVRWETLGLAFTIVLVVGLAAIVAGRMPAVNDAYAGMGGRESGAWHLRRDDLLFILLGIIPAAVLAGRMGYILIHLDYYGTHPEYWFDPGQGSLELSCGVIGGTLAGVVVAAVLGAPVGRWLHVASVPTLLGLGLGKLAMALGGDGQGIPAPDLAWATSYTGPGPWGSLAPDVPAHPAQVYEGVLVLVVAGLIGGLLLIGRFRDRDGRVFFAGLSLWALARVEAGFLWRDAEVLGPFRAAQLVGLLIAFASMGLFVWRAMETGGSIRHILAARARLGRPAVLAPVRDSGGVAAAAPEPPATTVGVRREVQVRAPARSGWLTAASAEELAATAENSITAGAQSARLPSGPVQSPAAAAAAEALDTAFLVAITSARHQIERHERAAAVSADRVTAAQRLAAAQRTDEVELLTAAESAAFVAALDDERQAVIAQFIKAEATAIVQRPLPDGRTAAVAEAARLAAAWQGAEVTWAAEEGRLAAEVMAAAEAGFGADPEPEPGAIQARMDDAEPWAQIEGIAARGAAGQAEGDRIAAELAAAERVGAERPSPRALSAREREAAEPVAADEGGRQAAAEQAAAERAAAGAAAAAEGHTAEQIAAELASADAAQRAAAEQAAAEQGPAEGAERGRVGAERMAEGDRVAAASTYDPLAPRVDLFGDLGIQPAIELNPTSPRRRSAPLTPQPAVAFEPAAFVSAGTSSRDDPLAPRVDLFDQLAVSAAAAPIALDHEPVTTEPEPVTGLEIGDLEKLQRAADSGAFDERGGGSSAVG